MNIIPQAATRFVGKQILRTKMHSPQLLFAGGVVGFGTTIYLTVKATLKVEPVLLEKEDNLAQVRDMFAQGKYVNEKDRRQDLTYVYVSFAKDLTRLYGPAVLTGTTTILLFTGSHRILAKRNAALTAAYTTLQMAFDQYRARVREELGEEKDLEFRHGRQIRTVVDEDGKGVKKSEVVVFDPDAVSGYARIFDESNPNWQPNAMVNRDTIEVVQRHFNKKLKTYGYVMLNDVYDALGFTITSAGQIVGWTDDEGDGYIDFGVSPHNERTKDFYFGREKSVLLDFNVQGPVFRMIDKKQETY